MKRLTHPLAALAGIALAASAFAGDRTLTHVAVIDAPPMVVWRAFVDPEEMIKWMVPRAEVDLRVGGDMRTSYVADSTLGDENTIVNRILSYEPGRMLSIRNVQAPAGFENAQLFQEAWSVIYFHPVGDGRTRVRSVGLGYGEGPEWDAIYAMFEAGNTFTFEALQKHFGAEAGEVLVNPDDRVSAGEAAMGALPDDGPGDSNADRTLELLHGTVGGEWIHDGHAPDGSVFRVRSVIEFGPDAQSLVATSWLGGADGMFAHGATLIHREPVTNRIIFRSVDENGSVAEGEIRAIDDRTLHWDWKSTNLEGVVTTYDVRTIHDEADPDTYRFVLSLPSGDGLQELVNISYTRVNEAPKEFRTLRENH